VVVTVFLIHDDNVNIAGFVPCCFLRSDQIAIWDLDLNIARVIVWDLGFCTCDSDSIFAVAELFTRAVPVKTSARCKHSVVCSNAQKGGRRMYESMRTPGYQSRPTDQTTTASTHNYIERLQYSSLVHARLVSQYTVIKTQYRTGPAEHYITHVLCGASLVLDR